MEKDGTGTTLINLHDLLAGLAELTDEPDSLGRYAWGIDELGSVHRQLTAMLDTLRPALTKAMVAQRRDGATLLDITTRSGYRSVSGVARIVDAGAGKNDQRYRDPVVA